MKIVDLSHVIEPGMPVFPGTEPPILAEANTIAANGFAEKLLSMYSHTGTHMDAPAHMRTGGQTLDAYPISSFYGKAVLVDLKDLDLDRIGMEILVPYESRLREADFLVLRTGWAEKWLVPAYFEGFPALTAEAAHWLTGLGLKAIGTDAISIDRMEDEAFPVHHELFSAGMFIIENLTNLGEVGFEFQLACFPLFIKDADGSPVRAVAICEET
ncbi:MAG: cyclase family protein [Anaerolineaceae bacterium]